MKIVALFLTAALGIAATTGYQHEWDAKPLNKMQVIGSHNSYKQAMDSRVFSMLYKMDSNAARHLDYSHAPLEEQLNLGLGALEIDIYADTKGGRYASPKGLQLAGSTARYDSLRLMREPGFKVLHVQDIDFNSHVLTFKQCLAQLKSWSDAHPGHLPVYITMNCKSDTMRRPGFTAPEAFTADVFNQLDSTIIAGLGKDKLLLPDDVRGKSATLNEAVLAKGWPLIGKVLGKFIFVLDETGAKRATYLEGHPSLQGRVLFTNAVVGTPDAAILIMNDAPQQKEEIRKLVQQGYIVRTRADAETIEARTNDYSRWEAALASGAQIISTDYYYPSKHFPSAFSISFPGKQYRRLQ